MDEALRACDALEKGLVQRIEQEYGKAALRSVRDLRGFFKAARALEQQNPPSGLVTDQQKQAWRMREMKKLVQKYRVESTVTRLIQAAGAASVPLIWDFLGKVYQINERQIMEEILPGELEPAPKFKSSFVTQQQREMEVVSQPEQTPFTKIAFENLEKAPALVRRLQNEMRQTILHGEGTEQFAKRIQRVMQNGAYSARRIAQTERTRVQSQARYQTMCDLADRGIKVNKEWRARMDDRTRDTHADLNGSRKPVREPFANGLLYPGDPNGPAREVINCRCVIRPVLGNVHYVGKLDKRMYKAISEDIVGDSVIITNERIDHSNRHKNAFDKYGKYADKVLSDPDFIIRDKNPKSAVLFRYIPEIDRTIQLVLRLHLPDDNPEYKNSLISYWDIGDSRQRSYKRNGDVIYKRGMF